MRETKTRNNRRVGIPFVYYIIDNHINITNHLIFEVLKSSVNFDQQRNSWEITEYF